MQKAQEVPPRRRGEVAAILEQRITRAVASGALRPGDRLPSTRKAGADLGVDARSVMAAYKKLSTIGLVTLAPRSGVYLAKSATSDADCEPKEKWLVETIANGIFHGSPINALSTRIDEIAAGAKPKAVVIALTVDHAVGLSRELHNDYGFDTSYILADSLVNDQPVPRNLRRAHVLVSTEKFRGLVETLADRLNKSSVIVKLRPDIISEEWAMLLAHPVYVVGMDARLLGLIKAYLRDVPGSANTVMMVAGHDDLSKIPPDAPTYVTEAARLFLGKTNIPGRLINPGRLIDRDSVIRLVELLVMRKGASRAAAPRNIDVLRQ